LPRSIEERGLVKSVQDGMIEALTDEFNHQLETELASGERMDTLHAVTRRGDNPTRAMIDALLADGSLGEVWGTVRLASGYPYDPFRVLSSPFGHDRPVS
jgi:methylmalonyl-CoA mutase N-terminal domain/subunit